MEKLSQIDNCLKILFPINRSIMGDGVRKTLDILRDTIPLKLLEYPTGQRVYDWTIPREWKIKNAWIKNSSGKKIIDFQLSNLHVVGYSSPVQKKLTLNELKKIFIT